MFSMPMTASAYQPSSPVVVDGISVTVSWRGSHALKTPLMPANSRSRSRLMPGKRPKTRPSPCHSAQPRTHWSLANSMKRRRLKASLMLSDVSLAGWSSVRTTGARPVYMPCLRPPFDASKRTKTGRSLRIEGPSLVTEFASNDTGQTQRGCSGQDGPVGAKAHPFKRP